MADDSFMGRSRVYFSSARKANRGSGRIVRPADLFVMLLADLVTAAVVS